VATVKLTSAAKEDVRDLDGAARKKVLKAMRKLETEPEQRGQPLGSNAKGNLTSFRKLVVGDREFRIVYKIESDGEVVVVWVVGARADAECYDLAVSRLKLYANDKVLAAELEELLEQAWAPRR